MSSVEPSPAEPRDAGGFGGRHAVVIGASVAGLVAATVAARHFARVTILDSDRLPDAPASRHRVPQSRHVHILLGAGLKTLRDLFPGIVDELLADGAVLGDIGESAWYHHGAWRVQFTSGIPTIQCSRTLLEHHVRRRVRAIPNVEIVEEATASGLRLSADRGRVLGVHVQRAGVGSGALDAELVADASGRSSQAPQWLEAAGYPRPPESRIGIDLAYVSRIYRCPERYRGQRIMLLIYPNPPDQRRTCAVCSIEGDRWMVSLGGYFGEHPPCDDAGFVAFSRGLPRPEAHALIEDAQPLTEPVIHRVPSDRRRHFERMPRALDGLIVCGDAACSFNPIYGQGMSVACLGATALDRCLGAQPRGDLLGLSARFQRALAGVTELPWRLATSEDLLYPEATGARPRGFSALSWYLARVIELCAYDTVVYGRLLVVIHLIRGIGTLLSPVVAVRVLRHALRRALAPRPEQARAGSAPLHREDPVTRERLSRLFAGVGPSMPCEAHARPRLSPRAPLG